MSPKAQRTDELQSAIYETAQTLKRLSSGRHKTPPFKQSQQDSVEQQHSPPTPLLPKVTQESLRKRSFVDQLQQRQFDHSSSSSRRISTVMNDDFVALSKPITPQASDRSPPSQSRLIARSNSKDPAYKDPDVFSSGDRSYYTSAAQSRRVSMGLNRSPVRAEELERVLTKVIL